MADLKISELSTESPLAGTELVEVVTGGINKKTTTQDIADLGGGAVDSVNGQTGVVVLDAGDVGADPAGTAAALLTTTISNGDTTHAPDGNSVFDALALKADLASPSLTGTPTAPTAAVNTNTTQLATTAFVQQSKFVYYVNDYGLVADSNGTTGNGTDNATALGSLVDLVIAAGGGIIQLGEGIYRYTGVLNKTGNNVTIQGLGMGTSTLFCDNTSTNSTGMRIIGNNIHHTKYTFLGRETFQSAGVGIAVSGSNNSVTFVEVSQANCFGIFANSGSNIAISNNVVHDCSADGIHVSVLVSRVTVTNNKIYTCADDGIGIGFEGEANNIVVTGNDIFQTSAGIAIMGFSATGVVPDVYNILVANNNIQETWLAGIHVHVTEGSIENVNITGNNIRKTGGFAPVAGVLMRGTGVSHGISVMAASDVTTHTMRNISITNNNIFTVRNCFISVGHLISGTATAGQLRDIKVKDNVCQGLSAIGGAGAWGFSASGNSNDTDDSLYPGIAFKNTIGNVDVSGNQIRGASMHAIRFASTVTGMVRLTNNQGFDCNAGGGITHAYVFASSSSSTQVFVFGNTYSGTAFTTGITSVGNTTAVHEYFSPQERTNSQSGTSYTIVTNDMSKVVALTNTAARAVTMPAASAWPSGKVFWVKDAAGTAGSANITMTRAGSDTFEGGGTTNVISTNYGQRGYYNLGSTVWYTTQ